MILNNKLYPWQTAIWQQLYQNRDHLPHAILLHGRAGIGKYDFARYFSQSLLCTNSDQQSHACGQCPSCHWFKEESHPDFRLLSPEQEVEPDEELSLIHIYAAHLQNNLIHGLSCSTQV